MRIKRPKPLMAFLLIGLLCLVGVLAWWWRQRIWDEPRQPPILYGKIIKVYEYERIKGICVQSTRPRDRCTENLPSGYITPSGHITYGTEAFVEWDERTLIRCQGGGEVKFAIGQMVSVWHDNQKGVVGNLLGGIQLFANFIVIEQKGR